MSDRPDPPPERVRLFVCDCAAIGSAYGASRCGRDSTRRMRAASCPVQTYWYELLPPDEQQAMDGLGHTERSPPG